MPRDCTKPAKPWPGFPLYAHRNGQWAKRIRGRIHYFGPWGDTDEAHRRYQREREDLEAGRVPNRHSSDGTTVDEAVNLFLAAKRIQADSGQLSERTWQDYLDIGKRIIRVFGRTRLVSDLTPTDFATLRKDCAKTHKSLVTISDDITRTKVVFNHAYKEGLIDRPVRYGSTFARPSRTAMRRDRQRKPPRLFTPEQIHALLAASRPQMQAMIHLGVNCGFGNSDCALLTTGMLSGGWVNSPRSKTAIMRHCPLWPETQEALDLVLLHRKASKDERYADRVFVTARLAPWEPRCVSDSPISKEFRKLLDCVGLRQSGLTFYALRHTFATVGKQTKDNDAVRAILGHVVPVNDRLSSAYDEAPVDDQRLLAVAEHVRNWLFKRTE